MSDLRATIMADQQLIASKRRFGLFSQPPPLAVGDDSLFKSKKRNVGQNGKPITQPAQLLAGTCRTGVSKSAYFQVPESILQGDPYKQRYKQDIQYQRKMHTRSKFHEHQFKPGSAYKTLMSSSYKYQEQNPQTKKKVFRDESGKVKTEARNFTTNPTTNVQTYIFKQPKHIPDPYERKRQLQKKQRQIFNSKLPKEAPAFKSTCFGDKPLVKDSLTYGLDEKTKQQLAANRQRAKTVTSAFNHEAPFKPAVKNPHDTIGKFPAHMAANSLQSVPKKHNKEGEKKENWKPNKWNLSRPTPSISLNPKNINLGRYK